MSNEITFKKLRFANAVRNNEWTNGKNVSLSFRGLELGGEVGELLNVVKKIEREILGMVGSRATRQELADEIADVAISLDLLAMEYNIDIESAIKSKFNKTSEKYGLKTMI